jgi:DUF2933 family protein
MSHHEHADQDSKSTGSLFTSRSGLVLIGFLAIGAFFLLTEHRAHLLGILPFLLLLLCPLMHLFHGGHGRHDEHSGHGTGSPTSREAGRSST